MSDIHQKSSCADAGPSWDKIQQSKNSFGKRQSESQGPHISPQLRSNLTDISQPAPDKLPESFTVQGRSEQDALGLRYRGPLGNKLFLDFRSMKIIKDSADEDSASDLSDSERVAIPPSPFTPPDLNLRAEEIDPVSFDLHPDPSQAEPKYRYPDFLPPPFSSWDLQDMAVLLNTESRSEAVPRAAGVLGRYVDRLLQLEWLQTQTVQWEKARAAKLRPPGASGASGALKSPGRGKRLASTLSKPLLAAEGAPKPGPSRRKGFHQEEAHPSYYALEPSPRLVDMPGHSRLRSQKQPPESKTEKKKKASKGTKPQCGGPLCRDGDLGMEASGNIRVPRQSAGLLDPADSLRTPRTQAHAQLKKKGGTNGGPASSSREKKPKTTGAKQSTEKWK